MENLAASAAPEPVPSPDCDKQAAADRIVKYHALAAAGLGLVPVPFLDVTLIAGTQLSLVRSLARLYDISFSQQLGKSAVAALIGGTLAGSSGSLLKLIPGLGALLGCLSCPAIASASTYGIGKVFIQHFESGGTFLDFDPERVRAHYQQQFEESRSGESADLSEEAPVQPEKTAPASQLVACQQELAVAAQELTGVRQQLATALAKAAAVTPSAEPAVPPGPIIIVSVRFLGLLKGSQADEFVELRNIGDLPQDLSGWRLHSEDPGQEFVFPHGTVLLPGVSVRVYTGLESPRPDCFSFGSQRALWNDKGDTAYLSDATGRIVAKHGYGDKETRSLESITAAFGVPGLRVVYEKEYLTAQGRHRGKMDWLTAVEEALRCLLEAPLQGDTPTAAGSRPETDAPADLPLPMVQERLRAHLDTQSLILLHGEALPEGITSLREHWIFRLEPGLGEQHLIFVSRTASWATYQKIS